ncbi:hypothetical protein F4861DRAFT_518702 [Xylaria intraflava]|nr:hypothetical protein F4861DRAFT_518702 [Xylaria intraflava]
MNKCPQETVDRIVSFLEEPAGENPLSFQTHHAASARPAIAAVSRKFQNAVERQTFRQLRVDATDEELANIERILTPRRYGNLRKLAVTVVLPQYPEESYNKFETDEDRQANNAAATATLQRLFKILKSRDPGTPGSIAVPSLDLEIEGVHSLSDKRTIPLVRPPYAFLGDVPSDYKPELYGCRYIFSLIDITSDRTAFPTLPCVRKFTISNGIRAWAPAVAAALTSRMPNVEAVHWKLEFPKNNWHQYYKLDKMYRDDLVRGIRSIKLAKSTKEFECVVKSPDIKSKYHALPNFTGPDAEDPVVIALRGLTRDCSKISLEGPFTPSLFHVATDAREGDSYWQNTTKLLIKVDMRGSNGNWLFDPGPWNRIQDYSTVNLPDALNRLPPGYGAVHSQERREAEQYFYSKVWVDYNVKALVKHGICRTLPNEDRMNALLAAFARHCSLMPALRSAQLECEHDNEYGLCFRVSCFAPGEPHDFGSEYVDGNDSWRVGLRVGQWRPTEATLDAFREIGQSRDGRSATICFVPWKTAIRASIMRAMVQRNFGGRSRLG